MSTERNHGRGHEVIDWDQELYDAIKVKNVEGVRSALEGGASVSATDSYGCTPLHIAASGSAAIVKLLLASGASASINTPDSFGNTPLHYSNTEIAEQLKEAEVNRAVRHKGLCALIKQLPEKPPSMFRNYCNQIVEKGGIECVSDGVKQGIINYSLNTSRTMVEKVRGLDSIELRVHTALCKALRTFPQCASMFEKRATHEARKRRCVEGGGKVEEQTDEMDAITTPLLDRAGASRSSSLTAEQRRLVERGENPYGDSSSQRGRV
jgi:hypothetical protein